MLTKKEFKFVKDLLRDGYSQDQIRMALEDGEFLNKSGLSKDEIENIHSRLVKKVVFFKIRVIGVMSRLPVAPAIILDAPTKSKALAEFFEILPNMNTNDFIVTAERKF